MELTSQPNSAPPMVPKAARTMFRSVCVALQEE